MEVKKITWFNLRNRNPELPAGAKGMIDGQTVCRIIMGPGDAYRIHIEGNRYLSDEKLIGIYFTELSNAKLFFEKDFVPHIFGLYFEPEPDYKRIIKQLYRLTLELVDEIAWNNAGLPHIKEYRKSKLDRFKKILGMEVKNA